MWRLPTLHHPGLSARQLTRPEQLHLSGHMIPVRYCPAASGPAVPRRTALSRGDAAPPEDRVQCTSDLTMFDGIARQCCGRKQVCCRNGQGNVVLNHQLVLREGLIVIRHARGEFAGCPSSHSIQTQAINIWTMENRNRLIMIRRVASRMRPFCRLSLLQHPHIAAAGNSLFGAPRSHP